MFNFELVAADDAGDLSGEPEGNEMKGKGKDNDPGCEPQRNGTESWAALFGAFKMPHSAQIAPFAILQKLA